MAESSTRHDPTSGELASATEAVRRFAADLALPTAIVDLQGRVAYANPALLTLAGLEIEELAGKPWFERFADPVKRARAAETFAAEMATGNLRRVTHHKLLSARGDERTIRWNNSWVRGADGPVGVLSVGEDVTDGLAAEDALQLRSALFRQLFERAPLGVVVLDNRDRVRELNPGFEQIFGWTQSEAVGRTLNELIVPDELAEEGRELSRTVLGGGFVRQETSRRRRDGSLVPVSVLGCPIELGDRQIGVYGIYIDVSERKRAEEALRRSEERYALAARGANDGLWDWDLVADRVHYSARWSEMIGHGEGELGASPETWLSRIHPSDRAAVRQALDHHLAGRSPHFEAEYRIRTRGGDWRWMLSRALAVRDHEGRPLRIAGSQTDIHDRKEAERRLLHDALHDVLTGLPNRALFLNRLGQAIERGRRDPGADFAVLFLDLDRFKVINDSLGHRVGDELLAGLAERLRKALRTVDTVARLGGDEFGFLLEGIHDARHAIRTAERILEALARPFELGANEVFTTGSIGIALAGRGYGAPEQIVRDADIAMYRAKALGRARYAVFDQEMHRHAVQQMQTENDLRRALERGELRLFYQPTVRLSDGRLIGFEALVRWEHPERGLVLPGEFIGVAEESGLIVPLGEWVLEEACRRLADWDRRYPEAEIEMSVNLSARQFLQPDLADRIREVVEASGIDSRRLQLEITESVLMGDAEATEQILRRLCDELGVGFSIDDFGTGYSSLAYLHRFPIDTLKIDRSFVSRMRHGDVEIARAVVNLGRGLELDVLAEGVEELDQLGQLRSLGCETAQGFLFSPPVPWDAAEQLLRQGTFPVEAA